MGKGLLNWKIFTDCRVTTLESTNVRRLSLEISPTVSFITCDLSFISMTKGLEKIIQTEKKGIAILALIKSHNLSYQKI